MCIERHRLNSAHFDLEQFRSGIEIELEHGRRDRATNVPMTIRS